MWARLIASIGAKLSGPLGWLAGIFIDKFLKWLGENAVKLYEQMKAIAARKQEQRKDDAAQQTYEGTLNDGVQNDAQVNATTDMLNRK